MKGQQSNHLMPNVPEALSKNIEKHFEQIEQMKTERRTTYVYYFRSCPDLTTPMATGLIKVIFYQEPAYNRRFHCNVYGKAAFRRPLSIEEQNQHDLIPEPRNHLHGVMKG